MTRTNHEQSVLRIGCEDLCEHVASILEHAGLKKPDARAVAENVVEAEARDLGSHGLLLLPTYVSRIHGGGIRADYELSVVSERGGAVLLDAGAGAGQAVAKQAMAMAVERAKSFGVAWVTVKNANHIGMLSNYVMQAVEAGMIGMAMSNTSVAAAPFGGVGRKLGTNPICIAVPSEGDPFILDMSTTTVAAGKIRLAALHGEPIGSDWITEADGTPTSDPAALERGGCLTPLGGHKGYGLAVAVDMLTAIVAGSNFVVTNQIENPTRCVGATQTFIAVDPEAFGGRAAALAGASARFEDLRDTPARDPRRPVIVPGDHEAEALRRARTEGIALTRPVLDSLATAARMAGAGSLPLPVAEARC